MASLVDFERPKGWEREKDERDLCKIAVLELKVIPYKATRTHSHPFGISISLQSSYCSAQQTSTITRDPPLELADFINHKSDTGLVADTRRCPCVHVSIWPTVRSSSLSMKTKSARDDQQLSCEPNRVWGKFRQSKDDDATRCGDIWQGECI